MEVRGPKVDTARLRLIPFAPDQLLALIEQPERFADLAGLPAAAGLREFFVSGEVSPAWLAGLRNLRHPDPWSLGFAVVHRESSSVIGSAGFKGAPDADGVVEVAYGIVPAFEGRGYATEATHALVAYAFSSGLVKRVRAHTLPVPNASTRVLMKCGFQHAGNVIDPDDGPVWRWERVDASYGVNRGLYVVMGVSGSGKSLIGAAFSRALGVDFVEGDEFHPAENVERMSRGVALTDEDRAGWLHSLAARIREAKDAGTGLVMTCSALKRSYRDILRAEAHELRFVFLRGEDALIAERIAGRRGHFIHPSLLESQFATLEEPSADEHAWVCDIRQSPQDLVAALVARISA